MRNCKVDDLSVSELLEIFEANIRHRCYCPCECICFDGIPEDLRDLSEGQIIDAIQNKIDRADNRLSENYRE